MLRIEVLLLCVNVNKIMYRIWMGSVLNVLEIVLDVKVRIRMNVCNVEKEVIGIWYLLNVDVWKGFTILKVLLEMTAGSVLYSVRSVQIIRFA